MRRPVTQDFFLFLALIMKVSAGIHSLECLNPLMKNTWQLTTLKPALHYLHTDVCLIIIISSNKTKKLLYKVIRSPSPAQSVPAILLQEKWI